MNRVETLPREINLGRGPTMAAKINLGRGAEILFALFLLVMTAACSGTGEDAAEADARERAQASEVEQVSVYPSEDASCEPGGTCECFYEVEGVQICNESDELVCDCSFCPDFTPAPTVPDFDFEACGGLPFGEWQLKNVETALLENPTPISAYEIKGEPSGLIILEDGGDATRYEKSRTLAFRFVDYSCETTRELDGQNLFSTECSSLGCNICDCRSKSNSDETLSLSWTRTETTITLSNSRVTQTYEYCVEDDQLQLYDEGVLETYERTQLSGSPLACSQRTLETCEGGCYPGRCVGFECDEFKSQSSCLVNSACSWNETLCGGTAPQECDIDDYDQIPGCNLNAPADEIVITNPTEFLCLDGGTIPYSWLCDNYSDCGDGSDESTASCAGKN